MSLWSSLSPSLLAPNNLLLPHHERPRELDDLVPALVCAPGCNLDDSMAGLARRRPDSHYPAMCVDCISVEDRLEELHLVDSEHEAVHAGDVHKQSGHEPKCEET